jgi:hypothetical protein
MKTYRVNERGLVSAPDEVVTLRFPRKTVEAQVCEIPNLLKVEGLSASMPIEVTVNGMKAGAFPCIIARSELSALALTATVGYPVQSGDGVSFATQYAARKAFERARSLGATLLDTELEWRLGSVTSPKASDPQLRLNLSAQPSVEAQLADSPFI